MECMGKAVWVKSSVDTLRRKRKGAKGLVLTSTPPVPNVRVSKQWLAEVFSDRANGHSD